MENNEIIPQTNRLEHIQLRRRYAVCSLLSILLVVICISSVQADCSWYSDCGQCVADLNCGWCTDAVKSYINGTCSEGNKTRFYDAGKAAACDGVVRRYEYYACTMEEVATVQKVKVYPELFGYYQATPRRQQFDFRVSIYTETPDDNVDLYVKKNNRPTQVDYDFKSNRETGPWGITVPYDQINCTQTDDTTTYPYGWICDTLYIGVLGDNRYPSGSGPSEYQIVRSYEFDYSDFSCAGNSSWTNPSPIVDENYIPRQLSCRACGLWRNEKAYCGGENKTLVITEDFPNIQGNVFFNDFVPTVTEFQSDFKFKITSSRCNPLTEYMCDPGDGFAFIILTSENGLSPISVSSDTGSSLGYSCCRGSAVACAGGLANGVVIEFDTYRNLDIADPSAGPTRKWDNGTYESSKTSHVSVFSAPADFFCNRHDSVQHRQSTLVPYLVDGSVHSVRIQYAQGRLVIYLDDMENPILEQVIIIDPASRGRSLLGFSASTGASSAKHEILSWSFCRKLNCSPVLL